MKVFVAIGGFDYEGYDKPVGVYSTKELAEAALQKSAHLYDVRDVLEFKIDMEPSE